MVAFATQLEAGPAADDPIKRYTDYRKMGRDPEIAAVFVGTPNPWHVPVTLEAVRRNKHVMVTNPLADGEPPARRLVKAADQTGADPDRIAAVEDRFDRVFCEMTPGTGLFFYRNLLHRSDANQSPDSRWALICCYTSSENSPFREGTKGKFSRIERWDDERVKRSLREHETRQSDVRGN